MLNEAMRGIQCKVCKRKQCYNNSRTTKKVNELLHITAFYSYLLSVHHLCSPEFQLFKQMGPKWFLCVIYSTQAV